MSKKIRMLSLLLTAVLSVAAFTGCSSEKTGNDSRATASYDPKDYPAYVTEGHSFTTTPFVMTVWVNNPSGMKGTWGDDEVSAWIKDTLNLDLDISYAATSTGEELSGMIIGNEKLPDLLVLDPESPVARELMENGYVLALDTLAKELYPEFLEIIPGGMQDVFTKEDGHFYHTAAWYGDPEAVKKNRETYHLNAGAGDQSLCLNRKYFEEMGSPKIDTPDQLFDYLSRLHAKYKDQISMPIIPYYISWGHTKDAVNFFYRMYGGGDWLYEDSGDNIHLCVDDPKYKQALQMMNKMYRAGLFTQEAFSGAYDIITTNLRGEKTFAYIGQDWQWFSLIRDGDQMDSPVLPIEVPSAVSRDQLKLKDLQMSTVGGNPAVFISEDCLDKKRALEYLAFRYTEECQIAERFGIEGSAWERNPEDNMISWTQEVKDFEKENDWQAASEKYGYNNGIHSWFTTLEITMLESTKTKYPIQQYNGELNSKYMRNERIYDLTKRISDDKIKLKYEDFVKAANEAIIRCLQAKSEAEFESEYTRYLDQAQKNNQKELEAYFTQNFKKWKNKGY